MRRFNKKIWLASPTMHGDEMKATLNYGEILYAFDKTIEKRTPVGNDYKFEDGM